MSNFAFLPAQFRTIADSAIKAESHILGDPRAACIQDVGIPGSQGSGICGVSRQLQPGWLDLQRFRLAE
jgi:hypothetical protein